METESTDWDKYYSTTPATARITRRITERKLIDTIRKYTDKSSQLSVCEFGGANSCFVDKLSSALPISAYHIIDTNPRGLALLNQRFPPGGFVSWEQGDVLAPDSERQDRYDIVYSVGLIEHFDRAGTQRAIAGHFQYAKPGGLVLITFPTPTWLYRGVRRSLEISGHWAFPDERPLELAEVIEMVQRHGGILHQSINWSVLLTQGIVAARAR